MNQQVSLQCADLFRDRHIVLASQSPRRIELLGWICPEFEVRVSGVDEDARQAIEPPLIAVELASKKALHIARSDEWPGHEHVTVIGADTVVSIGNRLFEKPQDEAEAVQMLSDLSGKSHFVSTGVCVCDRASSGAEFKVVSGYAQTQVTFRNLSENEILDYVQTGEPFDKAGGYAIQGGAASFVESVQGPLDSVVGLPLELLISLLRSADRG